MARDLTSRMGRVMMHLTWVGLLVLLTLFFNDFIQKRDHPNAQLMQRVSHDGEVILKRNREGHYIAPGRINDTPVRFLVDTGATMVSIPEAIANKLHLDRGMPMQSQTANGVVTVYSTKLDSIQLGGIRMRDVPASINPGYDDDTILLGMSFMRNLEMIQKNGQLTLRVEGR